MFKTIKQFVELLGWKEIASIIFVLGLLSTGLFALMGSIFGVRLSILMTYGGLFWLYKVGMKPKKI